MGCDGSTDQPFYDTNDAIVNIDFRWDNSAEPVFVRAGTGDPYEGDPAFRLAPDVQYVRDGRFGRGAYKSDFNDFAPRLGIAWAITPKTVLRSGGGIYYVRDIGNAVFDTVRNAPFTIRRDEPAESFRPNLSFQQPFARTGAPTFILANQYRRAIVVCRAVVVRFPARGGRQHVRRSDVLRLGRCAPAPVDELQQSGAEPAAELQQRTSVSEIRQHSGDERAKSFELPRALSEAPAAVLRGPELPQLLCVGQVDR